MTSTEATAEAVHDQNIERIAGQYLTFMLAGEEYGVDILRVQEIKGWNPATVIPNTPAYVLGVINLRGEIVPVVDMRMRFNLPKSTYSTGTVIIVVKIHHDDSSRTVGLVVDAVSEVYRLEPSQIQMSPDFGGSISTAFVRGLATVENKMLILLEVNKLIPFEAMSAMSGEN